MRNIVFLLLSLIAILGISFFYYQNDIKKMQHDYQAYQTKNLLEGLDGQNR